MRSPALLALAVVSLVLALALLVRTRRPAETHAPNSAPAPAPPNSALEAPRSGLEAVTEDTTRSELAGATAQAPRPEPPTLGTPTDAPAARAFPVRLRLDDPRGWFRHERAGTLRWGRKGRVPAERTFALDAQGRGEISLPAIPTDPAAFQRLELGPWRARVARIDGTGDEPRTLVLEPEPGARLEWDSRATAEERGPIELLGAGSRGPLRSMYDTSAQLEPSVQPPFEFAGLPLVLPRTCEDEIVWLRTPGCAWRSYSITESTGTIHVRLFRSARLRVLHDGPGRRRTVRTMVGATRTASRITSADPLLIDACGTGQIRLELLEDTMTDTQSVVARAMVHAKAGETVEVDLRESRAAGGLRVTVAFAPDVAVAELEPLSVEAARRVDDHRHHWRGAGEIDLELETEVRTKREAVCSISGLAPGPHRVSVDPYGWTAETTVRAGTVTEVRIEGRPLGRFALEFSVPTDGLGRYLLLSTPEPDPRDRHSFLPTGSYEDLEDVRTCATGHYIAALDGPEGHFESEPFEIRAGETTRVPMHHVQRRNVQVRLLDAATDAPVGLSVWYWVQTVVRDAETGETIRAQVVPTPDEEGGFSGAAFRIDPEYGRLRVELPEHEHYLFETVHDVMPDGPQEIVVHVRPR